MMGIIIETHQYFYIDDQLDKIDILNAAGELYKIEYYQETLIEVHLLTYNNINNTSPVVTHIAIYDDTDQLIRYKNLFYDNANNLDYFIEKVAETNEILQIVHYHIGTNNISSVLEYCISNKLLKYYEYNVSGAIIKRLDAKYDDTTQYVNEYKGLTRLTAIEYRDLTGVVDSNGLFPLIYTDVYVYDDNNLLARIEKKDVTNINIKVSFYFYNDNNQVTQIVVIDPNTEFIQSITIYDNNVAIEKWLYSYRVDNTLEKIEKILLPDNLTVEIILYDVHENLIIRTEYKGGNKLNEIRYTYLVSNGNYLINYTESFEYIYEYDDDNNIISTKEKLLTKDIYYSFGAVNKRLYYDDNLQIVREQIITYYDDVTVNDLLVDNIKFTLQTMFSELSIVFTGDSDLVGDLIDLYDQYVDDFIAGNLCFEINGEIKCIDKYIEDIYNCVSTKLGLTIFPGSDPTLFYQREVLGTIAECIEEHIQTAFDAIINKSYDNIDEINYNPDAYLDSRKWYNNNGFSVYQNKISEIFGAIVSSLQFPKPPKQQFAWQPTKFIRPDFFDYIEVAFQAAKVGFDAAFVVIKSVNAIINTALSFTRKKFDILETIVKKFVSEITNIVTGIAGADAGLHVMYLAPKKRSLSEWFNEFEKTFDTDLVSDSRFVPTYSDNNATCGIAWFFATPYYDKLLTEFNKLRDMFSLPRREDFRELLDLSCNIRYLRNSRVSGVGFTQAQLTWTKYRFNHKVNITITIPAEILTIVSTTIENINDNQVNFLDFNIEPGKTYKATVIVLQESIDENNVVSYIPFRTATSKLEVPTRKTELQHLLENTGSKTSENTDDTFLEGIVADATWFNASLDALFPDVFQFKQVILQNIQRLNNAITTGFTATERALQSIERWQDRFTKQVNVIIQQISQILEIWSVSFSDISYYQWIPPAAGGINYYKSTIKTERGIPEILKSPNMLTAGFFLLLGSPTLNGVTTAFEALKTFITLEDKGDKEQIQKIVDNSDNLKTENLQEQIDEKWQPVAIRAGAL